MFAYNLISRYLGAFYSTNSLISTVRFQMRGVEGMKWYVDVLSYAREMTESHGLQGCAFTENVGKVVRSIETLFAL